MIRCVVSDLGKVVVLFDNHIFFRKIADFSPFRPDEIAEMVHDHSDVIVSFDTGKITPQEFYGRTVEILKAKISFDDFVPIYNDVFSLNPPVLRLLKRLKLRFKLILLSNTDVMRFGFIKKKFPEVLIFDEHVLSYEAGCLKPHQQIYELMLKKAGVSASECIFIDDREENVKAAIGLGINSILFTSHVNLEDELRRNGVSD